MKMFLPASKKCSQENGTQAVRLAVTQAVRILAEKFVMGRSIAEALDRSRRAANADYCYSFDMLGESALTKATAQAYFEAYHEAIGALDGTANSASVKLSALHPRYEFAQQERVLAELTPRLLGQRCSALRVLFVQEEIADRLLELLRGAMEELVIGDPMNLATDVGPVIDGAAKIELQRHIEKLRLIASPVCELRLPAGAEKGSFVAPCAFEIPRLDFLEHEVFGAILHVIRFLRAALDKVIDAINDTGYGLTLGIASRIETTIRHIQSRARVGNIYVNRNMIGTVVGVQPFGGKGLSGTGPKAGGPNYLLRFATERTVSVNTAAMGGNTALTALD